MVYDTIGFTMTPMITFKRWTTVYIFLQLNLFGHRKQSINNNNDANEIMMFESGFRERDQNRLKN